MADDIEKAVEEVDKIEDEEAEKREDAAAHYEEEEEDKVISCSWTRPISSRIRFLTCHRHP